MKCARTTLILFALATSYAQAAQYTVIDLGVLPSDASSHATAINDRGQVAGYSVRNLVDSKGNPYTEETAFLWESGTMTQLAPYNSVDWGNRPIAINHSGSVLTKSFLWSDGVIRLLEGMYPQDMNDSGQILVMVNVDASYILEPDDTLTQIDVPGAARVQAYGMNNLGQVVGATSMWTFFWSNGAATLISNEPSMAIDVNDLGEAIGYYSDIDIGGHSYSFVAFSWQNGVCTELGPRVFGGSVPYAINNLGQIVGRVGPSYYYAAMWENGVVTDLNTLIPPDSGWLLQHAEDINDLGQIVGTGTVNGVEHGFLLTPIPEPSSLLALAAGIGGIGLGLVRRRRGSPERT